MSQSLVSAVFSVSSIRIAKLGVSIVFTPILVRLLGPSQYGVYAVILSVFAILNVVAASGTNDAVRKFISENKDNDWRTAIFTYLLLYAVIFSVIAAFSLSIATVVGVTEMILGQEFAFLAYLISILLVTRQFQEYIQRTLMGIQLESYSEPLKFLERCLFCSITLIVASLGFGVPGVLLADILASIITLGVGWHILSYNSSIRIDLSSIAEANIPNTEIRKYVIFTISFFIFLNSLYHVDVLLLNWWYENEVVGYYRGALSIAEILWFVPIAVQLALLQRVSNHWENDNIEAIRSIASTTTRYVLLFTSLLAIGMAILADDFVPLYLGQEFNPSIAALIFLLPGVVGFAAARPSLAINQGRRTLTPLIYSALCCAIVNIFFNFLLIPRFGMIGAAIATSFGYLSLILFQEITARQLGYSLIDRLPVLPISITITTAFLIILIIDILIKSPHLSLLVIPPLGLFIFSSIALLSGAIKHSEFIRMKCVFSEVYNHNRLVQKIRRMFL